MMGTIAACGKSLYITDENFQDLVDASLLADPVNGGSVPIFGAMSTWDVSRVTNMSSAFSGASTFNGDISNWDVSSVTNMFFMFWGAYVFNQDLSSWDTSSVTDMGSMFWFATAFDGRDRFRCRDLRADLIALDNMDTQHTG